MLALRGKRLNTASVELCIFVSNQVAYRQLWSAAGWASDESSGRLEVLLSAPIGRAAWMLRSGLGALLAIVLIAAFIASAAALGAAAELFLKTYAALGRPVSIRNLEFYKAAYHLKMIQRKIVKPYWRERIETTLEESLRNLGPTIV